MWTPTRVVVGSGSRKLWMWVVERGRDGAKSASFLAQRPLPCLVPPVSPPQLVACVVTMQVTHHAPEAEPILSHWLALAGPWQLQNKPPLQRHASAAPPRSLHPATTQRHKGILPPAETHALRVGCRKSLFVPLRLRPGRSVRLACGEALASLPKAVSKRVVWSWVRIIWPSDKPLVDDLDATYAIRGAIAPEELKTRSSTRPAGDRDAASRESQLGVPQSRSSQGSLGRMVPSSALQPCSGRHRAA